MNHILFIGRTVKKLVLTKASYWKKIIGGLCCKRLLLFGAVVIFKKMIMNNNVVTHPSTQFNPFIMTFFITHDVLQKIFRNCIFSHFLCITFFILIFTSPRRCWSSIFTSSPCFAAGYIFLLYKKTFLGSLLILIHNYTNHCLLWWGRFSFYWMERSIIGNS